MPVRIYDIAKRFGIESKQILAIAKELGITEAKVPSSSLDKITAEFLEEKLGPLKPAAPAASLGVEAPKLDIKAPEPERQPIDVLADPFAILAEPSSTTPAQPPKPITAQLVGRIDLSKFGARRETAPTTGQQQHGLAASNQAPKPVDPRAALHASAQIIMMKPPIVVRDLAELMKRKPYQLIADLIQMGIFTNVNQAIDEPVAIKLCAKHGFKFEVERGIQTASLHPIQAPVVETPAATSETPDLTITLQLAGPGAKDFMERLKVGKIQLEVGLGLPSGGLGAKKILLPLTPEAFKSSQEQKQELTKLPLTGDDSAKLRSAYGAASQLEGSEFVTLARFGDILKKLHPEFLPAQYGKASLSELVKAQTHLFEVQENRKLSPPVLMVRLKVSSHDHPETAPTDRNAPVLTGGAFLINEAQALFQKHMGEKDSPFLNEMRELLEEARLAVTQPISSDERLAEAQHGQLNALLHDMQNAIMGEKDFVEDGPGRPFLGELFGLLVRAEDALPKDPENNLRVGRIQHLKQGQNYGFVREDHGEQEFFFHASGLKDVTFQDLKVGDRVYFSVETTERGSQACNVERFGERYRKESFGLGGYGSEHSDRY